MRRWLLVVLGMALATAIVSEFKISPFFGTFRLSLGVAVFFFLYLLFQPRYMPWVGALTGLFIFLFRMMLEMTSGYATSWADSFEAHFPTAFYYFSFALFLHVTRFPRLLPTPVWCALAGGLIDVGSNITELVARLAVEGHPMDLWTRFPALFTVGMVRSFLVVGLYNMFELRQLRAVSLEQQKRMEKLLMILSELHENRLYLQKLMGNVEEITAASYRLYKQLASDERARDALRLAEEVHEVKKDAQRIVASLSTLIRQEAVATRMRLTEIAHLVAKANVAYARHIGKEVQIDVHCTEDWVTPRIYSFLSVLNNLVVNAVEAIADKGRIDISVFSFNGNVWIEIADDGPGVDIRDREWIFQPGFTTKFDEAGIASTGIGLQHVLTILEEMSGQIEVGESSSGGALFRVIIPFEKVTITERHGEGEGME